MKKLTAIILAGLMFLSLAACGGTGGKTLSGEVSYDIPEGKVIPDDAVLDVMTASYASWPYDENWAVWKYIKEAIGGTVNVTAVPSTEFGTKFTLIMAAPDNLPDVIGFVNRPATFSSYCEQGAFVAFDDYEEFLPDYNKFWNEIDEEYKWLKEMQRGIDGKVYFTPIYGMERSKNLRAWLYRKDIFDKHGIEVPETLDELYVAGKKLKELYPESYPFCMRNGMGHINSIGSTWKPNFHYNIYYDFENEKWSYGAADSEIMLQVIEFFKKMYDEQLIPKDYFTISASSWQELVTTGRGFIFPDYQIRMDFFNGLARPNIPEFNLTAMKPPHADNGVGIPMVNKFNLDPSGMAVANTGDAASIANAWRYINWFYSDEGSEIISWGKEGETFEEVNGKKKFIYPDGSNNAQILYGFQTTGAYARIDPEAAEANMSAEQAATTDFLLEYTYPELDPTQYLNFTADERTQVSDCNTTLGTFVKENIQKFIIGQRPLTEWDAFQEELKTLPVEELISIYDTAYQRAKAFR
ncbi:MAG: extracellular solute-binding protein [Oscillospiraceae bacterium]|nr:extracellular solute-binding protein [Oscillospiraceae bacterium]MBQ6698923.1 extracellular solute-binding protein [Oscillospiraceae bacterium]